MENWLDTWKREERSIGETAGIQIGKEQRIQEGELKQAKKTAHNLRKLGLSDEVIADSVGYDIAEVKSWK